MKYKTTTHDDHGRTTETWVDESPARVALCKGEFYFVNSRYRHTTPSSREYRRVVNAAAGWNHSSHLATRHSPART